MSSERFEHIQSIRQAYLGDSEQSKANQSNAIKILADDLNNNDAHFVFELIQNAEDNTYEEPLPYISFRLTKTDPTCTPGSDGALIIENNEIGFNRNDVAAICAIGQSTKKKEQGYIGEKGIGFKSVFRVSENPYIFSKGYHFCLPKFDNEIGFGYIVPQWIDTLPRDLDLSKTHIVLPLTKADFGYDRIEEMLRDIQPEVILFLSTLQEIRIKTDTRIDFTILKDGERLPEVAIEVEDNKVGGCRSDDFLVCTRTFNKPPDVCHEKREGIESREVSIAFPLDRNSTAIGKIFAYLPVRVDTGLPFLINADFILPSSREDIRNVSWNRWLLKCVADVIAEELLPLLKKHGDLKADFLESLVTELRNISKDENGLFYPLFSRLSKALMTEPFLPTNEDDMYTSAQKGVLVGSGGLIDLLNPEQLSLLFQTQWVMDWVAIYINERRTPNLWQFLRNNLNVIEIDSEMFANKLSRSFLAKQSDSWFIEFYKFLSIGGGRPPLSIWKPHGSLLRSKPILRLQDNSLVSPDESNVYLPMEVDSTILSRFVKVEIAQDEDARRFLKDLGVQEWDIVEEVLQQILPKYQDSPLKISGSQYMRDISKIRVAYETDSEMKKRQLRRQLMMTSFILAENLLTKETIYLSPDCLSFGIDGLWVNFSGGYVRVSVQEDIHKFLRTLGIPEWDIVKEVIDTVLTKYRDNSVSMSVGEYQKDIAKIERAFDTDSKERQTQLQRELYATPFVRVDPLHESGAIYLRPDQIRFGTEGRLWGNFSGDYIGVFAGEGTCGFLKKLGVSEWDITQEVITTILPKYRRSSPTVPINEHLSDFAKIQVAFNIDSKEKQRQFRAELNKVYFILVESSEGDNMTYQRPNWVYFSSDELQIYFNGNDSGKFISSKYPKAATDLFRSLGVRDSVRVERRGKNSRGHVVISSSGLRQRGRDGFDPDIRVDGLEHAIDNITPEKSKFIWNEIAKPYSDGIRGVVERTETQTYDDATSEPQISRQFGALLINASWLPDSNGNLHKPNELTLDDLPESFVHDMRLAKQLGMKKDEVAELAGKAGVPVEAIEELRKNPDKWKKFLEWEAAQASREGNEQNVNFERESRDKQDSARRTPLNSGSRFYDRPAQLNLPGISSDTTDNTYRYAEAAGRTKPVFPVNSITNPERWKIRFDEVIEVLPAKEYEQRMRSVRVTTATLYTRAWLKINYTNDDGQMICQVCKLEMPFKKRDGEYYFEAVEALTNEYFTTEHEAQFLALCPECAARYKEFVKQDEGVMMSLIDQLMNSDDFSISLKLGDLDTEIRFVERHWLAIREILKKIGAV